MESRIKSLQNISVVKCAVLLSLAPGIKREILCVSESEYSSVKLKYEYCRKEQWVAIIEKKAQELLNYIKLPEVLRDKVISYLPAIALRILMWSEYHEGILGLTRYYSLDFLKICHFTSQGVIDSKTAAEDIIKDVNLNIKQKYKLACIYCFKNYIPSFFREIVKNKNRNFGPEDSKWMEKPKIVKYWTCQLMGVVDNEYRNYSPECIHRVGKSIISSILSGSLEAVKYFLELTPLIFRNDALTFGVTKGLSEVMEWDDWIVFRDKRFDDSKESWIPSYFYVDIICFLLSNMTKTQQQKALHYNICRRFSKQVLKLFLRWPYQDYFMKTVEVLWDLIPEEMYAITLLHICDKIEPCKRKNLLYGEEKSYDYKKLLVDFWSQSPDSVKRHVLLNRDIVHLNPAQFNSGIDLLLKLLSLKKFTYEDEEIIWLILGSATSEERGNLMSAIWWRSTCISILEKEKFETFDRLLLLLCKSEQEASEFKKKLNFHKAAESICRDFLKYGKVNAVKSLINRISLPDDKLRRLKEEIIYSYEGMQHCRKLLSSNRYGDFEKFIKWFLPSNREEIKYKRELAIKVSECFPVHRISESEIRDFITRFTRSKLQNLEAIQEIKTSVADTFGRAICEDLIAGSSVKVIFQEKNSSIRIKSEFTGGQWGKVDEFLRWSLSNEMKIHKFKKTFHELASTDIHFQLIKARQWKVAKRFLEWLPLTFVEMKAFKKRMIFYHDATRLMLYNLAYGQDDEMHNLGIIDLFLRWHLTDKESVIEFRNYFFDTHKDFDEDRLKKLNSLIENYLDDLEEAENTHISGNTEIQFFRILYGGCRKRKLSVFPPLKKSRFSKCEVESELKSKNGCLTVRRSLRLLNKFRKT